jgi:hypothetical protein
MLRSALRIGVVAVAVVTLSRVAIAAPITIDFENSEDFFPDFTSVHQFSGVTFSDAFVLRDERINPVLENGLPDPNFGPDGLLGSLETSIFPLFDANPADQIENHAVLSNTSFDGPPIRVTFTGDPIFSFSGMFTYGTPISIVAVNEGGVNVPLETGSPVTCNVLLVCQPFDVIGPPNEILSFSSPFAIHALLLSSAGGEFFTLDNFTFDTDPASGNVVPEPATLTLVMLGGAGLVAARRRGAKRATRG